MESPDIKPKIPTDVKSLLDAAPGPGITKLKQSRYEDVWPNDVHAAFMEAIALYPPMGKRRLKYYRVTTRETGYLSDANRAKSFGRCQLIQSYILEKTGKNRSRKQVSSHLQRLKKIHNDNPAMRPLFSEHSYPSSDHRSGNQAAVSIPSSQECVSANISLGTRQLKRESDFDLTINLRKTGPDVNFTSASLCNSEASFYDTGSCDGLIDPRESFLPPQQYSTAFTLYPTDGDYVSEIQDPLLFKDAISLGLRAGPAMPTWNTSASSIPIRHLPSKCHVVPGQQITGASVDFALATSSPQATRSPGYQAIQWASHSGLTSNVLHSPLELAPQVFHTPIYPLQFAPPERLGLDLASSWTMWPDISLGSRECSFGEICLRYPSALHQYTPTHPETRDNSFGFQDSQAARSEVLPLPGGVSCSYALLSPTILSESVSNEDTDLSPQSVTESPGHPASPLVIRPTPVYPLSYNHSDGHMATPSHS